MPQKDSLCPAGWGDLRLIAEPECGPAPLSLGSDFVLLDDARSAKRSLLFRDPLFIVTATSLEQVSPALERVRAATRQGQYAAGYISYEAGSAFDPGSKPAGIVDNSGAPLLWMGIFEKPVVVDPLDILPRPSRHRLHATSRWSKESYVEAIKTIVELIRAGDIYQANFTYQSLVEISDDPLAHYARIRAAQNAGWGGCVNAGGRTILSFSPEMMIAAEQGGQLWSKPMKGTASRHREPDQDRHSAIQLSSSSKDKAENLMIVDLLRNDLSRVAKAGSVAVTSLFEVEAYPTIYQMTSTISAQLLPGRDLIDMVRAIFPCGSITGAPKFRSRQIISDLEQEPRGIYTGAIGFMAPHDECALNVAIRTLVLPSGQRTATLGLGSGITADSVPDDEWMECQTKARFISV